MTQLRRQFHVAQNAQRPRRLVPPWQQQPLLQALPALHYRLRAVHRVPASGTRGFRKCKLGKTGTHSESLKGKRERCLHLCKMRCELLTNWVAEALKAQIALVKAALRLFAQALPKRADLSNKLRLLMTGVGAATSTHPMHAPAPLTRSPAVKKACVWAWRECFPIRNVLCGKNTSQRLSTISVPGTENRRKASWGSTGSQSEPQIRTTALPRLLRRPAV